ncbi:MAG: PHP domain-containing protein [Chloroflexi bacterium]|nr:PHP domain-containing protein [Chloroflexota bacterium]
MLKADLHLHTRYSMDCATPLEKLVARCQSRGLNCIAVTDHNTIEGALKAKGLAPFTIIVGEEISTTDGDLIGLFLAGPVPPGLPPLEAVQRIKDQGGLVSIPHPFDRLRSSVISPQALKEVLPCADIIEVFNARNAYAKADRQAAKLAFERGLPGCAVSDAHTLGELGRTYVSMPEFDGTPQGFLASLRQGSLVCHRSSPVVHVATTYNRFKRRLMRV